MLIYIAYVYSQFQVACPITKKTKIQRDQSNASYAKTSPSTANLIGQDGSLFPQ